MLKATCKIILSGLLALPLSAGLGGKAKSKAPVHPVDLNTASVTELMQLPKVGAHTAQRIVAWRKEHGSFRRPEEVMHVKGIGEKGFQRLRPFLQAGGSGSVAVAVRPGSPHAAGRTPRPSTRPAALAVARPKP